MDVNASRFFLLKGQTDWLRELGDPAAPDALSEALVFNPDAGGLSLQPLAFRFVGRDVVGAPTLTGRRGGARDRFGNWYWVHPAGDGLWVRSSGSKTTTRFWSAGAALEEAGERPGPFAPKSAPAPTPGDLRGMALTADHHLVVGAGDPATLLVFDLHAGGPPSMFRFDAAVPFAPFDLAALPGGGFVVLDRENARFWRFDRRFALVPPESPDAVVEAPFQPKDGGALRQRVTAIGSNGVSIAPIDGAVPDPVAIAVVSPCDVLVLDRGPAWPAVRLYRDGVLVGDPVSLEPLGDLVAEPPVGRLLGDAIAFVPDGPGRGRLYIAAASGDQTFVFELEAGETLELRPRAAYHPMRRFGGKGLVVGGGAVYYDLEDRWVPLLEVRRPRFALAGQTRLTFDAQVPATVWHRLLMDGRFPVESVIAVRARAADTPADLALADWIPQPSPIVRAGGREVPFVPDDGAATAEVFFQRLEGRHVELELTMRGDGRHSAVIQALRIYHPRFSYLREYLPATYQHDADSARFLDGFLGNVEGTFTALEDRIAAAQVLFDPEAAPAEALDWLGSWMGVVLDPTWAESQRRQFIRHAAEIFRARGTLNGVLIALNLALGDCEVSAILSDPHAAGIRLIEGWRQRVIPAAEIGDPSTPLPEAVRGVPRWRPSQGRAALESRWREALEGEGGAATPFPIRAPASAPADALWPRFCRGVLGFVPQAEASVAEWRAFLAQRYADLPGLRVAHGVNYPGATAEAPFANVPGLNALPATTAALRDWYLFEGLLRPIREHAHHFSVAIPVERTLVKDSNHHAELVALAQRIVCLAKPAHTTFDVRLYWALLRLGFVRLGVDTALDEGSRAATLMPPLELGGQRLGESWLPPNSPDRHRQRNILGDPPLGPRRYR